MFESNKLDAAQTDALTWLTLAVIAFTCLYFVWVIAYEVILAFRPQLCSIGHPKIESEDPDSNISIGAVASKDELPDVQIDSCKMALGENALRTVQKQKTEILSLQGELESARVQVQRYQQEIDRLKRRPPQVGSSSSRPHSATSSPSRLPTPEAFASSSSRARDQRYTPFYPHRFVDVRRGSGKHRPSSSGTSQQGRQEVLRGGDDTQEAEDIETIAYFENPINSAR